ncbi:MAG: hypothetical protein IPK76_03770 [Lewinellaceae bacterium]|nr:hypothetical protein [Lewinellaceae bacterium]
MKRTLTQFRENLITKGLIFLIFFFGYPVFNQAQVCNVPLVGKGRVIDQLSGGTACLLCNNGDLEHIVDGDLSNYAEFSLPVVLLSATPVVGVKDINNSFAAGTRAGFVVKIPAGLLDVTLLSSFQIRTYLDNSLQETVSVNDGLSVGLLAGSGGKQRISFVTSEPYDEIELLMVSTIGLLGTMRIYYAYEEPANGCDYTCRTPLVTGLAGFNQPSTLPLRVFLAFVSAVISWMKTGSWMPV